MHLHKCVERNQHVIGSNQNIVASVSRRNSCHAAFDADVGRLCMAMLTVWFWKCRWPLRAEQAGYALLVLADMLQLDSH